MGLTNEKGEIYEFMGLGASRGKYLSFGPVTRYVPMRRSLGADWNLGILEGCRMSEGRLHKGCWDNCHTFVADCLNSMRFLGCQSWNSIILALLVLFFGRYTSLKLFLYHVLPSAGFISFIYMVVR